MFKNILVNSLHRFESTPTFCPHNEKYLYYPLGHHGWHHLDRRTKGMYIFLDQFSIGNMSWITECLHLFVLSRPSSFVCGGNSLQVEVKLVFSSQTPLYFLPISGQISSNFLVLMKVQGRQGPLQKAPDLFGSLRITIRTT